MPEQRPTRRGLLFKWASYSGREFALINNLIFLKFLLRPKRLVLPWERPKRWQCPMAMITKNKNALGLSFSSWGFLEHGMAIGIGHKCPLIHRAGTSLGLSYRCSLPN